MDDIAKRNQDIVIRAVSRETFAALAAEYGISRERVRQIWDKNATPAQKSKISAPSRADKPSVVMSRREPKTRIHVLTTKPVVISHGDIRRGIAKWSSNRLKVTHAVGGVLVHRVDILLPEALESKFRNKCDKVGIKASAAVRAIITALESAQ